MKREFLTALGVTDSNILDRILSENEKDIESERSKYSDYDGLKEQLAEADRQLGDIGGRDVETIKKAADEYRERLKQFETESMAVLEKMRFEHALDSALSAARVRNIKAVRSMLDTDKLSLSRTGGINGLDEQLNALRRSDGYLFETENLAPRFSSAANIKADGSAYDNAVRAVMGLPHK